MQMLSLPTGNVRRFRFLSAGLALLITASVPLARAERAAWLDRIHPIASATASWVDNLSRTSAAADRRDGATLQTSLSGGTARQLAPNWLLTGGADVAALWVRRFPLADEAATGGDLALVRKFGLGAMAWNLRATTGVHYVRARFPGARGWTTVAGLELAKRIVPELRATVGVLRREHAAGSPVFDLGQDTATASFEWQAPAAWTVGLRYTRLKGDLVAEAAGATWAKALSGAAGAEVLEYYSVRPWAVTHRYGPNWVSYNVAADANLWVASLGRDWSDRVRTDLEWEHADVVNSAGIRYPRTRYSVRWSQRF